MYMNKLTSLLLLVVTSLIFSGCGPTQTSQPTTQTPTDTTEKTASNRPMDGQESFGLDVCNEVPQSLVTDVIGNTIEETEDKSGSDGLSCTYYVNKADNLYILIKVVYLSPENQRKGQEALGRTISTDPSIPMNHFIALEENGQINSIYLIMTENKYVRIDRTEHVADDEQMIILARKVAIIITGQ